MHPCSFVVVGSKDNDLDALVIFRKHLATRPKDAPSRLLLTYRGGKSFRCPHVKNSIAKVPRIFGEFNGLDNVAKFTGHALRRTAETWMADAGVDMINLKRFGGIRENITGVYFSKG